MEPRVLSTMDVLELIIAKTFRLLSNQATMLSLQRMLTLLVSQLLDERIQFADRCLFDLVGYELGHKPDLF